MRQPGAVEVLLASLFLFASVAAAQDPAAAPGASPAILVTLQHERLTVRVQEAPLDAVLREIGRRASIEITILGSVKVPVSAEFHEVPIEDGLRRLLRGHGWARLYARSGDTTVLKQVVVVPGGPGPNPDATVPPSAAAKSRAIAEVLERADVRTLLDTHLHASHPRERRDAMSGLLDAVQSEELSLLIDLVQDERATRADWETALAPLSSVLSLRERWGVLRALADPAARDRLAEMLESHLAYKTREGGARP